jgi:Trehalose utilisation
MLAAIAERHNAYVLMVNQVGGNDGSSSTARRDGRRICRDPSGQRHRTFLAVVRRPGGRILPKSSRHPDSDRSCGCPNNPSTSFLGSTWQRTDEWYNFATNPRGNVHVLLTLDESTYSGGTVGADHPLAWRQVYDGGRSWYTENGHKKDTYSETLYQQQCVGRDSICCRNYNRQLSVN